MSLLAKFVLVVMLMVSLYGDVSSSKSLSRYNSSRTPQANFTSSIITTTSARSCLVTMFCLQIGHIIVITSVVFVLIAASLLLCFCPQVKQNTAQRVHVRKHRAQKKVVKANVMFGKATGGAVSNWAIPKGEPVQSKLPSLPQAEKDKAVLPEPTVRSSMSDEEVTAKQAAIQQMLANVKNVDELPSSSSVSPTSPDYFNPRETTSSKGMFLW